jgi:malignant T-cell-amplified sequence
MCSGIEGDKASTEQATDTTITIYLATKNSVFKLLARLYLMFRTLTPESVGTLQTAKSSVARKIREDLTSLYPMMDFEVLMPKKATINLTKLKGELNHVHLLSVDGVVLFFQDRDGPWLPTLVTVKKFPAIMAKMQVDKGAKDFLLRGAKMMAPGLVSAGGFVSENVEKGKPVQIWIENETEPQAVGVMLMSSEEVLRDKKGQAIDTIHYIGDGLCKIAENAI